MEYALAAAGLALFAVLVWGSLKFMNYELPDNNKEE